MDCGAAIASARLLTLAMTPASRAIAASTLAFAAASLSSARCAHRAASGSRALRACRAISSVDCPTAAAFSGATADAQVALI